MKKNAGIEKKASRKEPFGDAGVIFKSITLFTLLTILNISVFVFMVFENQFELIGKNTELETRQKGAILRNKIEDIVIGQGPGAIRNRQNVSSKIAPVYARNDRSAPAVDTLEEGETVFSEHETKGWARVVYRTNKVGWVSRKNVAHHVPAWQTGTLSREDIRLILNTLRSEGIRDYAIFSESGLVLADSEGRTAAQATEEEQSLIKKAIFKSGFENIDFHHKIDKKNNTVKLYIPIYYSPDKLFVLRPVIPIRYMRVQKKFLYHQCIIVGFLVLFVHILFVLINERIVIRPMVRERTRILKNTNEKIQAAKDKLEVAYRNLNEVHSIVESELDIAREIQLSTIPSSLPSVHGYSFWVSYLPAEKVGGDFYNFYNPGNDCLGIVIADASGHGIPAAFIVSMATTLFAGQSKNNLSPSSILTTANIELGKAVPTVHYLTAFYSILHIPTGQFRYTRGGHPLPFHYHGRDKSLEGLDSMGSLLGLIEKVEYDEQQVTLEKGDRVVFFTDGVFEAMNSDLKCYGYKNLEHVVAANGHLPADQLGETILNDVKRFTQGRPLDDDLTLLILERS